MLNSHPPHTSGQLASDELPILPDQQVLNPLIFPSETDGRFRMFVVGVVMLAVYTLLLFIGLITALGNTTLVADIPWLMRSTQHLSQATSNRWILDLSDQQISMLARELQVINANALVASTPRLVTLVLFVIALLGLAFTLYYAHPWHMRRRRRLLPLSAFANPAHAEKLSAAVARIAVDVGLERPPAIEIMTNDVNDAQIFGLPGRYILRLDARPQGKRVDELYVLQHFCLQPEFRALVLHEFGHIANGDIGRSYFASGLWSAFTALIIAPIMLLSVIFNLGSFPVFRMFSNVSQADWNQLITGTGGRFVLLACQIIALMLIVRANQHGILRTREFYADWRAALWGADITLTRILSQPILTVQHQHPRQWWRYWWVRLPSALHTSAERFAGWWQKLWGFHSSREKRYACLKDPTLLFTIAPDLPFLSGVLLAFVMIGLPVLIIYISLPLTYVTEVIVWSMIRTVIDWPAPIGHIIYVLMILMRPAILVILVLGLLILIPYLVVGSLGQQIQRDALTCLLPERRHMWGYMRLWKPAFVFAIGLELGLWIIPFSVFTFRGVYAFVFTPIWIAGFTILTWLWMIYVHGLTHIMLGSNAGKHIPRSKSRIMMICSIICLWVLYLPTLFARNALTFVQRMESLPIPILPTGMSRNDFYLSFALFPLALLAFSLLILMVWSFFSLGSAWLWQKLRRRCCATCGQIVREPITVGRRCPACYSHLAPWLYVNLRS